MKFAKTSAKITLAACCLLAAPALCLPMDDGPDQEIGNMTLGEIKLLQNEKMQERSNMTLNQLLEENKNRRQMATILEGFGFGRQCGLEMIYNQ